MKVFVDTNVLLRYLMKDHEQQYQYCFQIIELIENGVIRPYISSIVVLEIQYVLRSVYNVPKHEIRNFLQDLLSLRSLTIQEKSHTQKALQLHWNTNVKLSDCLITTQVPKGAILCTYDQDFQKFNDITVSSPQEIVESISL